MTALCIYYVKYYEGLKVGATILLYNLGLDLIFEGGERYSRCDVYGLR